MPSSFGWIEWDVTDDVQNFIDGNMDNYGWQMIDEQYWGGFDIPFAYCRSKEYGSSTPYLEINYEEYNNPPENPTLTGDISGKVGRSYMYSAITTDPDDDKLYYKFDWGDGNDTDWIGTFDSNKYCNESHIWKAEGAYVIKVKAKDIKGAESDWTTLSVSIPKNKNLIYVILDRFPIFRFLSSGL